MNNIQQLPIHAVMDDIIAALANSDALVLEAAPGAGKTTCVPLALLDQPWAAKQKIIMLEPRRLAARAAAERMAKTLGEAVGETVGYRIRFDSKVSAQTRIEVVTEGIFIRQLQLDPTLENIALVIFDEFHERSLDADSGLAMALMARDVYGDLRENPLKLLVMSATLDGVAVSELLHGAAVVSSDGRNFPVAVSYQQPWRRDDDLIARLSATVEQALAINSGSVLVFLPGQGEIRRLHQRLQSTLAGQPNILLAPLYGDLSLAAQRAAIEAAPAGKRKVVMATNIAETSLTIEGVSVVVDSGLCRRPQFDPNTGMTRLLTSRISRAASTQRAGRAGRLSAGVCYRLWSESQQQELANYDYAEIEQADLAPLVLQLLQWGVQSPTELRWLTPPPPGAWSQGVDLLLRLGAVAQCENKYAITHHGEAMASFPAHPRLAHMMLVAQRHGCGETAAQLAALLSDKDPLLSNPSADLHLRLQQPSTRGSGGYGAEMANQQRLRKLASQFNRQLKSVPRTLHNETEIGAVDNADVPGFLVALAYPDRIAQNRKQNSISFRLANGRSAVLREQDPLRNCAWLAVAHSGGQNNGREDRIFLAAKLNPDLFASALQSLLTTTVKLGWDDDSDRLLAQQQRHIGQLNWSSKTLPQLSAADKVAALLQLLRERGLQLLKWPQELQQWRQRILLVRRLDADSGWPDVSDQALLAGAGEWLAPYLESVNKLADFAALDTQQMLHNLLPWSLQQRLDELAPSHITVASGNRIAIDYCQQPPVLAVKLQEMFGCTQTPRVVGGLQPLLIHLLSPARRPLQITQDLAGFWAGSYQAVKKEMKGRYPKHPWPDDPLTALPTAKVKARM